MSSSSPPTPTSSGSLESTLSSPALLLDYTRLLLRQRAVPPFTATAPVSDPLAVLLFLLDALTFLTSANRVGGESTLDAQLPAASAAAEGTLEYHGDSAGMSRAGPSSAGAEEEEAGARGPGSTSTTSRSREPAAQAAEETWEEWSDYVAEVYLYPSREEPTSSTSSSISTWRSPLSISPSDVSLTALVAQDGFDEATRGLLLSACTSALSYLIRHPFSPPTELPPSTILDQLLSHPSALPLPRPPSILCTISSTLSSQRRSSGAPFSCPSTRTFRWTVSTVMEHFFGESFRPVQQEDGEWAYAASSEDDVAIKKMCSLMEGTAAEYDDEEEELDQESGIRAANLSISRRDDKMRWVFGNDFQKNLPPCRPSSPTPGPNKRSSIGRLSYAMGFHHHSPTQNDVETLESTVDISPTKTKGRRPASMSSFDSFGPSSTSHDYNHRRVTSTSSSNSPLIDPPSPTSPRSPQHRRGFSTGNVLKATQQEGISPTMPLANLAENDGVYQSPSGTPSRRVSLDGARLPPTTNALSAQDRKELLRRSRKLEQMFGVPMEEDAVQQVLLRGQMERQNSSSSDTQGPSSTLAPQRPSQRLGRSRSFTHDLPISPVPEDDSQDLALSSGTVTMSRSRSHPGPATSSTESCFPSSARIHNPSSYSAIGGTPEAQREERRKKMAKLQRLLGEKVPAHLALSESPGRGSTMSKQASRLGGMFKGAASSLGRGHHGKEKGLENKQEELVVVEKQDFEASSKGRHKAHGAVDNMAKARKLENVFGDLPPKGLYMSHRDARRDSESSNLTRATSIRTIDSFRNSIVSLQHLAETDPEALDAIVEVYATPSEGHGSTTSLPSVEEPHGEPSSTSSSRADASTDKTDSAAELLGSEAGPPPTSFSPPVEISPVPFPPIQRSPLTSSSRSHHRTSRRATKLADRLGTTRGEVWSILLDDLQTAIEEEEGLDDDEREEVLGGVSRLREGFV